MMEKLGAIENKEVKKYTCVFSDSHKHGAIKQISKAKRLATNKRKERRTGQTPETFKYHNRGKKKKHIKNLSNKELTNDQVNLLAKGLKFIPIPVTKQTQISSQEECVSCLFFEGKIRNPKSTWKPPIAGFQCHAIQMNSI